MTYVRISHLDGSADRDYVMLFHFVRARNSHGRRAVRNAITEDDDDDRPSKKKKNDNGRKNFSKKKKNRTYIYIYILNVILYCIL